MLTVIANSPGEPTPACSKFAAEGLTALIDFTGRLREHELLVRVLSVDADGAIIQSHRCNGGRFVQLVLGADTVPAGQAHLDRNIKFVALTTQGSVSGSLAVRVYP